ncbi:MAG: HAD family hydrolase [Phocaeicola sp.]
MDKTRSMAALFDFDGVVVDTEGQYTHFWDKQGAHYLGEKENFGRKIKGQTLKQIFDGYFAGMDREQDEITRELHLFEEEMSYEYIPGVVDFMKELREAGISIAIVTSSNNAKMEQVYKVHPELKGMVHSILTAESFTRSKPDPDCFLLAASLFGIAPVDCVVFEDSFHGLAAGRAAGMCVVGLSTTNSKLDIVDKCNEVIPDFVNYNTEKMEAVMR